MHETPNIDARTATRFRPGRVQVGRQVGMAYDSNHRFGRCANCADRGRLWTGVGPNPGGTPAHLWVHASTDAHLCGEVR